MLSVLRATITATTLAAAALVSNFADSRGALGEELPFPREHHPWGHFPVGSWKLVRTTLETLDDKDQVVNVTITDTRTTLVAVDATGYTLRTDATVDVASRKIVAAPQTTKHGFYGETPGRGFDVKRLADAALTIDGLVVPCEVRQVVVSSDNQKLFGTVHYSSEIHPFVLRREMSLEGAADEKTGNVESKHSTTLVEVVALDLPHRVRGELKPTSHVKTTQKLPQSTKITLEVHCEEVPGGVVAHWASETDASGRVLRRSTLELSEYGVPSSDVQPQRLPMRRARKAARRMDQR
jgi:hypothetical protein